MLRKLSFSATWETPCFKSESDAIGGVCSSGEQPAEVGTTNYVWGASFQSEVSVKSIQPSYDRVGLDTQDHTEVEFDTRIGMLIIMELADMRQWSPKLIIERADSFESKRSMAMDILADLQMKTIMTTEPNREYAHQ